MTVGIGDTSVLFIPPTGPPTVTVIEATSGVSSFAMTSATDTLTGDVYVGLAADAAPFGMTLLLRVDGTSLVALPGAPAYPMGTILFATEAVGFDVYDGVVYPIDVFTDTISTWDSFSATTAVAGNGIEGFAGDGGSALSASFANPQGIDVTGTGIYIADSDNHRVRRVNAAGVVSTIAGTGTSGLSSDGGEATDAELSDPSEVAVDVFGFVWISDDDNDRIRLIAGEVED